MSLLLKEKLDELYCRFNRKLFVHPDPLEFLYGYERVEDREIAAFIASALAYGRVEIILKSVGFVLGRMSPSPFDFIMETPLDLLEDIFNGFVHRFQRSVHIVSLISRLGRLIRETGSLENAFLEHYRSSDETVIPAMTGFVGKIFSYPGADLGHLVPRPERRSACKRLHLFLRWMVRSDDVDPGGWNFIPPSKLVVPLDVHMHRIGRRLNLTERIQGDINTALEITGGFSAISPKDPVRYDFALTRMGIRSDFNFESTIQWLTGSDR